MYPRILGHTWAQIKGESLAQMVHSHSQQDGTQWKNEFDNNDRIDSPSTYSINRA